MTREEAIETLRKDVCNSHHVYDCTLKTIITALQTLIPELNESEDERIRKEMIDYFSQYKDDGLRGVDITPWIAYLEKQKEQKHDGKKWIYEDEYQKDLDRLYNEGKDEVLNNPAKYGLQKEQKPSISIDQLKSMMLQYLQEAANEKDDSDIEADTDKWARKILGYDFEQKPNIELIQRSWYMEGYHDREFGMEPKWITKTGEGGPKHELNPKYGEYIEKEQKLIPKFKVGDRIYDKRDSYNRSVIREVGKDYYINAFAQKMDMVYTDANFEFLEHLDNDPITIKPPKWSKEDDFKLGALITDIETRSDLTETIKNKYVSFLKSLRFQPRQEWSEEDEAHRKFISESFEDQIRFCKKNAEGAYYAKQIRTAQNWLNDLPNKFNID